MVKKNGVFKNTLVSNNINLFYFLNRVDKYKMYDKYFFLSFVLIFILFLFFFILFLFFFILYIFFCIPYIFLFILYIFFFILYTSSSLSSILLSYPPSSISLYLFHHSLSSFFPSSLQKN